MYSIRNVMMFMEIYYESGYCRKTLLCIFMEKNFQVQKASAFCTFTTSLKCFREDSVQE
ncbi:hypothetical protein QJS10_CPA09g00573 [Acorus calamus]|uniref:Uncharacterized protein n=1 Tax=Acorus calamus TaxID=4465 RepID=A0AAV9E2U6_ACOCL|nr:hypothetical protein QJS10_CPA09g00573 [Acorus calamus]